MADDTGVDEEHIDTDTVTVGDLERVFVTDTLTDLLGEIVTVYVGDPGVTVAELQPLTDGD